MGVVYKLKPGVKEFILEAKGKNPNLSCRGLASLIKEKLNLKVSKSSINAVIKEAGLSMSVGRRRKKRRKLGEGLLKPVSEEQVRALTETPSQAPVQPEVPIPGEPIFPKQEEPVSQVPSEAISEPGITTPSGAEPETTISEPEKPAEEVPAEFLSETPVSEVPAGEEEVTQPIPEESADKVPAEASPEALAEPTGSEPEAPAVEPEKPAEEIQPETLIPAPSEEEIEAQRALPEEPTIEQVPTAEEVTPTIAQPLQEEPSEEVAPTPTQPLQKEPTEEAKQPPVIEEVTATAAPVIELPTEADGLGALILKAADYCVGGIGVIVQAIKNRLNYLKMDLQAKTETLLYSPLFGLTPDSKIQKIPDDCGLWALLNQRFTQEEISSFCRELAQSKVLEADIFGIISTAFQEVRGIKISLSDGSILYLDGQLYTIWSASQIPFDFAATVNKVKSYINRYFKEEAPFVLFMAPGFDIPTKEFFSFILGLDPAENRVVSLGLYGNTLVELEAIHLERVKKYGFVLGLWPWQFGQFRSVNAIGEFRPFRLEPLKKDLYIAEGQVELSQPDTKQRLRLRACFVKISREGKIYLIILSNLAAEKFRLETLAETYLNHWPNLEEAYLDFSRKVELFTYMASAQQSFSIEGLIFGTENQQDVNALLELYLKALDSYARWHFLPSGYESKDFATMKERFYGLKASIKKEPNYTLATFKTPFGYSYSEDLKYLCRRLNEKEVVLSDGKRLWFSVE